MNDIDPITTVDPALFKAFPQNNSRRWIGWRCV